MRLPTGAGVGSAAYRRFEVDGAITGTVVATRIMNVQLKAGHGLDQRLAWISNVRCSKTWQTAYWHARTLARWQAFDSKFYELDTKEDFWLSGSKRDRTDARYSSAQPSVDEDAREACEACEACAKGAPLPGREGG